MDDDEPLVVLTDPAEPATAAAEDGRCPRCGHDKVGPTGGFGSVTRQVCFKCAHEWEA